jgi:hypothetical protein
MQDTRRLPISTKLPADYSGILLAGLLMLAVGWYGLYVLVTTQIPRVGQRWLFFVLLHIAVTGTMIPFVRYFTIRFTPVTRALPPGHHPSERVVWHLCRDVRVAAHSARADRADHVLPRAGVRRDRGVLALARDCE